MRIVIDLQSIQSESRYRGIGRYSLSLVKSIIRNNKNNEIILCLSNLFPDTIKSIYDEFEGLIDRNQIKVWDALGHVRDCEGSINADKRDIAETLREIFIINLNPDFILITSLFEGYVDDAVTSIKKISPNIKVGVILYDLIPYINDELYLKNNKFYENHYLKKIKYLKKADLLFAISESSKNEAIKYLNIKDTIIYNISSSVDDMFVNFKVEDKKNKNIEVLNKYSIYNKFIMYAPGGFDIRKNFDKLIEGYALLPENIKDEYQLVIVSKIDETNRNNLYNIANRQGIDKNRFIITGYVSDSDLMLLYSNCSLFVFPSLHEGFGLPVLEAMNCGAVVIGSNTTSIPEVIGYEEALFDPNDSQSIKDKIMKVLTDITFKNELEEHNKNQIKKFSWDRSALTLLQAIENSITVPKVKGSISISDTIKIISDQMKNMRNHIDLLELSKKIDFNFSNKQLFIDVSELCQRDSATGVQRVVRSYLELLLKYPPLGYNIFPVYGSLNEDGYRYANKFLYRFGELDYPNREIYDDKISYDKGDIFFGLDLQHHIQLHNKKYFLELKNNEVIVKFLLHDLLPIQFKDLFYNNNLSELHHSLLKLFASMDGVISVSKSTKEAFNNWLSENEIIPMSNFQNEFVHNGSDINNVKHSLGLPIDIDVILEKISNKITFLCVSTIEPRKKQDQILSAFELLWKENIDINIVFVGKEGWGINKWISTVQSHLELNKKLFWFNDVSDEFLEILYERSTCLIMASLNEGFGLPLIESAQHKLPIIARDIPIFREVAGDFAYYFNNDNNPEVIKGAILDWLKLYDDNSHPKSDNMPYSSWEDSTKKLVNIITTQKLKKRFFIDISELVVHNAKTGIQRVVCNILLELFKNPPIGYIIEPVYATQSDGYKYAKNYIYKFLGHSVPTVNEKYIEYSSGDIFLILDLQPQVQICHCQFYNEMIKKGVNVKFVIYDLLPINLSHYFPDGANSTFDNWLKVMTTNTNGCICISKSVAEDFSNWYSKKFLTQDRNFSISYFHLGADILINQKLLNFDNRIIQTFSNKMNFLMVSTIEPRKGHKQCLTAFEMLWSQDIDINLIIVGKKGWMMDDFIEKLDKHPELNKRLFWLDSISDEFLEKIYKTSTCLIAASEGEGFGLPLIEAAQHKLPIIARDIPVFREVAGEFAYYFENNNSPEVLERAIIDWINLYKNNSYPKSDNMPWLTWKESTRNLVNILAPSPCDF